MDNQNCMKYGSVQYNSWHQTSWNKDLQRQFDIPLPILPCRNPCVSAQTRFAYANASVCQVLVWKMYPWTLWYKAFTEKRCFYISINKAAQAKIDEAFVKFIPPFDMIIKLLVQKSLTMQGMALEQPSLYCLSVCLQQGYHYDPSGCGSGCTLMCMWHDCLGKEDPGTEQGANQLARERNWESWPSWRAL